MRTTDVPPDRNLIYDRHERRLRLVAETSPFLSSSGLGWQGYSLECFRMSEAEWKDVVTINTTASLQLRGVSNFEWSNGGHPTQQRIAPGQVSIFPANTTFSSRARFVGEFASVALTPAFVAIACQGILPSSTEHQPVTLGVEDPFIEGVINRLRLEVESGGKSGKVYSESLAAGLAAHLTSRYRTGGTGWPKTERVLPKARLRAAIEFIEAHLHEDISLDDIAKASGFSPFHFSRLFKKTTGFSPYRFVVHRRINRAKGLLLRGDSTIAEVALSTGFFDQSHMTTLFKKLAAITPGEFIQHHRARSVRVR